MRFNYFERALQKAVFAMTLPLLAAGVASAQSVVNLTATRQTAVLPDGNTVPMWGWVCGTVTGTGAACTAMNGKAQTTVTVGTTTTTPWQPPLIIIPAGAGATPSASLTINLSNSLPVETSITIVGQLGGGLGSPVRETAARVHDTQTQVTWTTNIGGSFTPPSQGPRVRSFVPEVAANAAAAVSYAWSSLKPGTYLIETGTYPSIQGPMGLYGVLVVTSALTTGGGTAYSGTATTGLPYSIQYDADVPLLLSEIDPVQNTSVEKFAEKAATCPVNTGTCPGTITEAQEEAKWTPACGAAGTNTCYPPAVDYTPLYYLVNGVSFSKDAPSASAFTIPATLSNGNVLLRFVNAGLRLHMPSVNGLAMSLIAEDGNVLPDVAIGAAKTPPNLAVRVQSDVFLPAGKVHDVVIRPANNGTVITAATAYTAGNYQVFDRELSLSTNNRRDGGMQAILQVGAALLPTAAAAHANPDTYYCAPGVTLNVSDPGKGVLANDVNVYGVTLTGNPANHTLTPFGGGSLTLNPDGTFVYTQPAGALACGGTFTYYVNGVTLASAVGYSSTTVTISPSTTLGSRPTANPVSYSSNVASVIKVSRPGALAKDTDPNNYPLTAAFPAGTGTLNPDGSATATFGTLTVILFPDGSFTATRSGCPAPPATCAAASPTFPHIAVNSELVSSAGSAPVTLNFNPGSGLQVVVQDAKTLAAITDYKWIIEQDRTFKIDPACQVNGTSLSKPANCPTGVVPSLGTNFHTSYMPPVAVGCTGPQSCERNQTMFDPRPACLPTGGPVGCSPTGGQHVPAVCEGSGICVPAPAGSNLPTSLPGFANLPTLDPVTGRPIYYYLSVLPGDAANPFNVAYSGQPTPCPATNPNSTPPGAPWTTATGMTVPACGHTMGGAPIVPACTVGATTTCTLPTSVTVNVEPNPLPLSSISVYIWEDDDELNGEVDTELFLPGAERRRGNSEPGLADFQLELWDSGGGTGDLIGQMTYDMLNEPLTNALNGVVDPLTNLNACPISGSNPANFSSGNPPTPGVYPDAGGQAGPAVGVVLVCPEFESDGKTRSPLIGRAMIRNLMPGKYAVIAHPGAAREARGEEWLQTNTLDGGHFLDSFLRMGEPAYFQEYGPAGFHVFMGMVNPKIINDNLTKLCAGLQNSSAEPLLTGVPIPIPCNNTIKGQITNLHISRPPDERLYDSGVGAAGSSINRATLAHTTAYVSLGVLDSANITFTKCDADGNFVITGVPDGNYQLTVIDQWLDQLMFEKEVTVIGGQTLDIGTYPVFSWQSQIWTNTYMDLNQNGIQDPAEAALGLIQIPSRVRFRNGRFSNTLLSDIHGLAHFNEVLPIFNWYTVESDTTRFRGTGVHVVNDAGGPLDTTGPYAGILNSKESNSLLPGLRVPGAVYCAVGDAACNNSNFSGNPTGGGPGGSTGRIDPGSVLTEGVQVFAGEPNVLDWGKIPYVPGETGGIRGHVTYNSTRPFDDPALLFQNLWEPLVPGVTINLYQEGTAPDGTLSLTLVDTTTTSSWDDWAQGFRPAGTPNAGAPNMNCPGQDPLDPFFNLTLAGTRNYLTPNTPLPNNSQYKCYDGMHVFNQVEPAPYDGLYQFPSPNCAIAATTFTSPLGQTIHCVTVANPANLAPNPVGGGRPPVSLPAILPPGKYVVEEVTPPNYEIVKEEDKNILIGDAFIAPVTLQFNSIVNIFIVPDQASLNATNPSYTGPSTATNQFAFSATGIPNGNIGNPTTNMGRTTFGDFGPGAMIIQNAPCVGQLRIVPDFMSASPEGGEVAPFAGASRHLCDRKEVTLEDQMQANAEFFIWTKTPAATHFAGFILDDFSSEFDPNSPGFGEKFAVPNLPVSIKDYNGTEVSRIYSDQWGIYNGLVFSTWQVNPPNPAGYAPGMMITCMNDPGPILDTRPGSPTLGQMITDPMFNSQYSDFCYENPFMPGDNAYLDTPVVPISAFADAYNPPDCAYPDATPAILRVDGQDATFGPYVNAGGGRTLTITALGDQLVLNNAYSGPAATTSPFNEKFITRHYGFGGTQGTVTLPNPGGQPVPLHIQSWTDTQIVATTLPAHRTGELVITTAPSAAHPSQRSIDTVTVTIGGTAPTYVNGENASNNAIQLALDAATPGDLIMINGAIVPATPTTTCGAVPSTGCTATMATYPEMLIMWKPVRLQGVGAGSVRIDANPHPAGKLDPWRAQMDCLFNIGVNNGTVGLNGNLPLPTCPANMLNAADPLPDEAAAIGANQWNLDIGAFEVFLEPTLMSAEEGAGITIVGKNPPLPSIVPPLPPQIVQRLAPALCLVNFDNFNVPGNYYCAPSRVDGMSFTNSQAGGGIYAHGFNHTLEISNNRVFSNGGTITGGIRSSQIEIPTATVDANGNVIPFYFNYGLSVHNNSVTNNVSFGDEFNVDTPAAGGGVAFCTGSDYYHFNYNWVCGNLSTGNGGGVDHRGMSLNGDISHNTIIFNQSFNQTEVTHGGGVMVEGEPNPGPCVGPPADLGCPIALSDGSGNVTVDSNVILGNLAEGGSGGGIRLENVNGVDVGRNPNNRSGINPATGQPWAPWWQVNITNNIIADNEAGWAGGGASFFNAVNTTFTGNAVISNDATAVAGNLFDTVGTNQSSTGTPPPIGGTCGTSQCIPANPVTTSTFQPAGLETELHSPTLVAAFGPTVFCPSGQANCTQFSNPVLNNDVFWQNRSFHICVGTGCPGPSQLPGGVQNVVQLTPTLSQTVTGSCPNGANYWDLGVNGDSSQTRGSNPGGYALNPQSSTMTNTNGYSATNHSNPPPASVHQYCNGSRVPPEIVASICVSNANNPACSSGGNGGHSVPPGIPDIDPFYPLFVLNPAATVDEGNNWINIRYGPLSLVNASVVLPKGTPQAPLGQYLLPLQVQPSPLSFGRVATTTPIIRTITVTNPSVNQPLTGGFSVTVTGTGFTRTAGPSASAPGTCSTTTTLAAGGSCTINVTFAPTTVGAYSGTLTITDQGANSPQTVLLSGSH